MGIITLISTNLKRVKYDYDKEYIMIKIKKETRNMKRKLAGLILIGSMIFAAHNSDAASLIKIDGSSTVYPITEAVAEEFQPT